MADRFSKYPRHPIAKRLPMEPPPRIEINVRRKNSGESVFDDGIYDKSVVCDCFPRTSTKMVPSMFYDKIVCPHQHDAHIQPAQETQFNYPWTANTVSRRIARGGDDDELSERLSLISEEDDQLRFSPPPIRQKEPDVLSIQTAPPIVTQLDFDDPRMIHPPYTAPANDPPILTNGRRVMSVEDIRNPTHKPTSGIPQSRGNLSPSKSRLSNRQFTGNYVDPRKYIGCKDVVSVLH